VGSKVKLRAGVRADTLYFDVNDRLGNLTSIFNPQTHLPGYRRTALGVAYGPRTSVEFTPIQQLSVAAAYGEGYRSPQPLQLQEGENAPFTKVRGGEVGGRWRPLGDDRLLVTGALYWTALSNDLAFDPQEGRLEETGPTTRKGCVVHAVARPAAGLLASVSATYVRATLDEPPPPTAEDPNPQFVSGQRLPYVPPLVLRADLSASRPVTQVRSAPLVARGGLGFTALSSRPLPFERSADPVALLDLSAGVTWRTIDLGLEVFNALDSAYAASEFSFVSNWGHDAIPSRSPARHFAAGAPRTVLMSIGVGF
jgi:outer membrane receptor protein involved in Fe transport